MKSSGIFIEREDFWQRRMTGGNPRLKLTVFPRDSGVPLPSLPLSSVAQVERVRGSLLTLQKASTLRRSQLEENVQVIQSWMTAKESEKESQMMTRMPSAAAAASSSSSGLAKKGSREDDGSETSATSSIFKDIETCATDGSVRVSLSNAGILTITPPTLPSTLIAAPSVASIPPAQEIPSTASSSLLPPHQGSLSPKTLAKWEKYLNPTRQLVIPEPRRVEGDFSKTKPPPNQIPIAQFWSFCEQMLRPLTEADMKWLSEVSESDPALSIPSLGRPYTQQWAEEDALLFGGIYSTPQTRGELIEVDDTILPGDVTLGPLAEKLLSSLIPERIVPDSRMVDDESESSSSSLKHPPSLKPRSASDMVILEDRIKKELEFLGLYQDGSETGQFHSPGKTTDDEICNELKRLQGQLRETLETNVKRKSLVKGVAQKWMAYQEYNFLLDEINKSIQQSYAKRITAGKRSHKKKSERETKRIPDGTLHTLRTRKRLLQEIGNSYFSKEKFGRPSESLFFKTDGNSQSSVKTIDLLDDEDSQLMVLDSST